MASVWNQGGFHIVGMSFELHGIFNFPSTYPESWRFMVCNMVFDRNYSENCSSCDFNRASLHLQPPGRSCRYLDIFLEFLMEVGIIVLSEVLLDVSPA